MITTPSDYIKRLEAIQKSVTPTIEMIHLGTEPLFIINTDTREITVPPAIHQLGVVSDHNAETIYLQIDRYFDDADLSQKTCVIQYINAADEKHLYPIAEKYIDEEKGKLTFAWKLSGNVTKAAGIISFSVRFYEIENDAYLYNFNTKTASFMISDGLDIREDMSIVPSPTDIIILVEHLDQVAAQTAIDAQQTSEDRVGVESLVDSVVQTITDKKDGAVKDINTTTSNQIGKIGSEGTAQINKIQQKGNETLESIPNDYVQISSDVSDLKHKDIRNSSMFSNALIGKVTGEGQVVINDAANAAIPCLEIDGASEQVVTAGAQLFDINNTTFTSNIDPVDNIIKTSNGVKFTVSLNSGSYGLYSYDIPKESGVYNISCDITVSSNEFRTIRIGFDDRLVKLISESKFTGNTVHLEAVGEISDPRALILYVDNIGKTPGVSVEFANIMIAKGDTALPWEPYTGGKPSPSPDYPQEIVSVAHVANSGAQLFDVSKITIGKYISPGTGAISSGSDDYCVSGKIYLAQGDYVLNGNTGNGYNVGVYQNDTFKRAFGIEVANVPTAISLKDGENCVILTAQTKDTPNIMLNAGSTPIPWEPYNGQQREIDLEITTTGVNLFDVNGVGSFSSNGTVQIENNEIYFTSSGGDSYFGKATPKGERIPPNIGKLNPIQGGTRIVLILSNDWFDKKYFTFGDSNGVSLGYVPASGEVDVPLDAVAYTIRCGHFDTDGGGSGIYHTKIQVQYVSGDTTFYPYDYRKVTIPLAEPLSGIGDVKDQFCMRDGVWGVERQFGKIVLDGNENEKWTTNASWTNPLFSMVLSNSKKYDGFSTVADILCDKLKVDVPQVLAATIGKSGIALGSSPNKVNSEVFIAVADHVDTKNIERFRSWLAENPIEMVYPLAESTWEPFPAETQATLNALTTHPGTTYLTVTSTDVNAPMRLEYVQDINKVISQLYTTINDLKAATAK